MAEQLNMNILYQRAALSNPESEDSNEAEDDFAAAWSKLMHLDRFDL